MYKRRLSQLLGVLHVLVGSVPIVTALSIAVRVALGRRVGNDEGMAWGVGNSMFVAPLWLVLLIVTLFVDLIAPRTSFGLRASPAFPIGFVLGLLCMAAGEALAPAR